MSKGSKVIEILDGNTSYLKLKNYVLFEDDWINLNDRFLINNNDEKFEILDVQNLIINNKNHSCVKLDGVVKVGEILIIQQNLDINDVKYINIKEFRKNGFLQELNRQFLNPLGMSLMVIINEDGSESLGGIVDNRTDKVGVIFDLENKNESTLVRFEKNVETVMKERKKHAKARFNLFGTNIEPIRKLI